MTEERWPTHYDTIPHTSCLDRVHCDCECQGCLAAKEQDRLYPLLPEVHGLHATLTRGST